MHQWTKRTMGREIDAYLLADGGATVGGPGPSGAGLSRGMARQEGLGMTPEVRDGDGRLQQERR